MAERDIYSRKVNKLKVICDRKGANAINLNVSDSAKEMYQHNFKKRTLKRNTKFQKFRNSNNRFKL